jgi:ferredoxin--NADP+ reductase
VCAPETVTQLLRDLPHLPCAAQPDPTAVPTLLEARKVAYVTLDEWLRLDRHEQERGRAQGRPRVKVASREAMLRLARRADRVPGAT